MKGWKTWTAALGGIGTGLAMIADGITGEVVDPNKIYTGLLTVVGALVVIGLGHKIEKAGPRE